MSPTESASMHEAGQPPGSMIDAKQAAAALGLPVYWFADPKMRARYRIPHYQFVSRVRFRLSDLTAWSARFGSAAAAPQHDLES
jgi:hypothetical protein